MLALGLVLFPAPLFALITLSLETVPGSPPLVISGTPIAIMGFGTVSPFEPLGPGLNRSVGSSDYTISASFGVRVTKVLSSSSNYTLRARLQSASPLTWKINGNTLTTGATTVATLQPYGTAVPHTVAMVIPFTQPGGAVSTVIEVTAIAN